ncbi:hypothetical protein OH77DRAFT_1420056 [Trametes cingulata]|nr:hypothetical protein OH77DRAFT_1420056 [Trametes cingulata]
MPTIPRSSGAHSAASSDTIADFTKSLDVNVIKNLALAVRTKSGLHPSTPPVSPSPVLSCAVNTPPENGAYNVVYHLHFSDGVSWVIRIPYEEWGPLKSSCMRLDIIAMQYISSHTTIPIPRLHAYSYTTDNALGHPYMIMDEVQGTCLYDAWKDPSWWTGERRKENLFQSLAGYMTQLAGLEFDKIGRLDRSDDSQAEASHFVAPFPSGSELVGQADGPHEELGPFDSTRAYLMSLVDLRRPLEKDARGKAWCALAQMFVDALPDARYDSAPFTFDHPDFNTQNIFVDDTGRVVGMIDWDGVSIQPRQIGAMCYPTFVTLDWNPGTHGADPEEMHQYRQMYAEAVRIASDGKLDAVVRTSHVAECVCASASSGFEAGMVLIRLGEYVFGSATVTLDVLEGLEHGSWLTIPADEIARVKLWHGPDDDASSKATDNLEDNVKAEKAVKVNGWVRRISGWVRRKVLNAVRSWTPTATKSAGEAREAGREATSQRVEPTSG